MLRSVPQGDHEITVTRPGYKPYSRRITIEAKTETSMKVTLAPTPSRSDAVVAYVIAAVFGGGGIYFGTQANKLHDDLAEGDRRRHSAAGLERSAVPARQDLRDLRRRGVRASPRSPR